MKPNFALDLSHDGIGLVHRGKGGWVLVDEIALSDPDLMTHIDVMRRTAADLESGGITSKLIIPGSEILFTSMTAPGPDDISRTHQIREGLEGLTPYAVDDLVFDWHADTDEPGMVHVAVVARETLDEAEGFAKDTGMNPVSFVARPKGGFTGEAHFGPTAGAGDILKPGVGLERDNAPVPRLLGKAAPKPGATAVATAPDEPGTPATEETPPTPRAEGDNGGSDSAPSAPALPELAPFPPTPDEPAEIGQQAATPATPVPPSPASLDQVPASASTAPAKPKPKPPAAKKKAPSTPKTDSAPAPNPDRVEGTAAKPVQPAATPPVTEPNAAEPSTPASHADTEPAAVAFSTRRSASTAEEGAGAKPVPPASAAQTAASGPAQDVPSRLSFGVTRDASDTQAPAPTSAPASEAADAVPAKDTPKPAPSVTAPIAFEDDPDLAPLGPLSSAQEPKAARRSSDAGRKLADAARKGAAGLSAAAGAASALGREAASRLPARKTPTEADTPPAPQTPAPQPATAPPPAKQGRLGALSRKRKAPSPSAAAAPLTAAPPPQNARAKEAEALTIFGARQDQAVGGKPKYLGLMMVAGLLLLMALVAIWSLFFLTDENARLFPEPQDQFETAITTQPVDPVAPSLTEDTDPALIEEEPPLVDPLTAEAAQARYAATGIWQRAPDPLAAPETGQVDDLYVASIDPGAGGQDAVALPAPTLPASFDMTFNTAPPVPANTVFDLDERGLVRATPQGVLTPDGVFVIAGRPPLVPSPRPGDQAPVEEVTPEALAQAPSLRPRARPDGLIEGNERLLLGGRTRNELARLRPRARPSSPQAIAQAEAIAAALEGAEAADQAAQAAAAAAIAPTKLAIARSPEPKSRPRNFGRIVSKARENGNASDGSVVVAAASPRQTVTPKIPTRASVAKQATVKNAINLRKVSLIGIYGPSSSRRALVRLPSGRYVKVGVGNRLDGGKVLSITASQLTYRKGSRNVTLKILPFG
ncbi:hypothetical protein [Aliiroseovarius marinus]|uniref:hypothetical protein n=1 Tax=Aliiroseovarius marinus TaxID=2500159 RepID=UPI003D7CB329